MDIYDNAPKEIKSFITYLITIRGRSQLTAREYFFDLRNFFRFIIFKKNALAEDTDFNAIEIDTVNIDMIKNISTDDIYDYLMFMARKRKKHQNSLDTKLGIENKSMARKISALRSFYKYLTEKVYLVEHNPTLSIEPSKFKKTLPKHLTLNESVTLLNSVDGRHKTRDFCIITLFLNCGLRVSELALLNVSDVSEETLRVLGKGNKERIVYLNDNCKEALAEYMGNRVPLKSSGEKALFISGQGKRINVQTVKWLVKKHIGVSGLDKSQLSVHKLRHTAATLMYQNGVDVGVLQEFLGHENLNTTKIYTHVSSENLKDAANKNPLANIQKLKKP